MTNRENLRAHLRAARKALVSDAAYQEAVEQLGDEQHERIAGSVSKFNRAAIDLVNGDAPAKPRRIKHCKPPRPNAS